MGLISSALQIGRSAILSYQSALQVVGNNISNAGNPDYTRQTAGLSSRPGVPIGHGLQPGAGVALTSLKRNLDESLESRIRVAIGDQESARAQADWIGRIEAFFDELSGAGLSTQLTAFFNGLSDVQNHPDDTAIRTVAISNGAALAASLQRLRSESLAVGEEINSQIELIVQEADTIAARIAELNTQIVAAEAAGNAQANALRDQRDALLRDLSETFDVTVRAQPDGSIYVYIGSEPLVQGGLSRGLIADRVLDGQMVRTVVRFAGTNAEVPVAGGRIEGLISARENQAYGRVGALDQLAAGIITEVNRIHADGQGLVGFTSVTGTYQVSDSSAALNSPEAGLNNPPANGSFFIVVADDATQTPVAYQIDVDLDGTGTDTTLESLAADISATVQGVTASITADNSLKLTADTGTTFTFGHDGHSFREDTSNTLAALGINTFFEGSTAGDIRVNPVVESRPELMAASTNLLAGDGENAGRMAGAIDSASPLLGDRSILEFYNDIANDVAVSGAAAKSELEATGAILSALTTQKENISGVSLDEEAIELVKFERAFQGAARYLGTVDRMLIEMLNIVER